jgi:hypothetical protein
MTTEPHDFAEVRNKDAWLRHPVLGDPSFDAFVRPPGSLIYRGVAPREWAVNGFLFDDPQGGGLFAYVGRYPRDYKFGPGHAPADSLVLRSRDDGRTWEELSPVFAGDFAFAGETGGANIAPDVTVVYADGRYHLAYDWVHDAATWDTVFKPTATCDSGVGYAWAERPEGPFHRHPEPILRNISHRSPVHGKYRRLYGSTLLRRRTDWLLLTLTDSGQHFAWGLYALTAANPEGPWSEPQLVQSLESDDFQPALMEFFPAFSHDGNVFAPATSVALNRNFQCLWRAPLESAHTAAAWSLHQHGSVWHAETSADEHDGIWGQTFSGVVEATGRLRVLFPSRDAQGCGTINLAERPWAVPLRERGFVLSGCAGPSLTLLRKSYRDFTLRVAGTLNGTARLLWGWRGVLGPDRHSSDATLHPLATADCFAWEWRNTGWRVLRFDAAGRVEVLAHGSWAGLALELELKVTTTGHTQVSADGAILWSGITEKPAGHIGLWLEPRSRVEITTFAVDGNSAPGVIRWHWLDAFLASGVLEEDWETRSDPLSPGREVAVRRDSGGRLKWNFYGSGVRWWAPRGPELGRVRIKIDGQVQAELDLHASDNIPASSVFEQEGMADGGHTLVIETVTGRLATGVLEVTGSRE